MVYAENNKAYKASRDYYEFISSFVLTKKEDEKTLGKFYTNPGVTNLLISAVFEVLMINKDSISIIDPFCGDGRLIDIFLRIFHQKSVNAKCKLQIYIWDIDETAVQISKNKILNTITELNLNATIHSKVGDAFLLFKNFIEYFDICITNPPWSILKPQKITAVGKTEEVLQQYKINIETYTKIIAENLPKSQPKKKFGKWGTNLARAGVEVALNLIKTTGICGVVSPATLLNDQTSVDFRNWIFDKFKLNSVYYFPAEMKLFGTADISSIIAIFTHGITGNPKIRRFKDKISCYEERQIQNKDWEMIKNNQYCIPLQYDISLLSFADKENNLIDLDAFCIANGLKFTREIDETRINEKITNDGDIRFIKGYMINQFHFEVEEKYISSTIKLPESVYKWKIVWRDVSRNTQARRIKATIIPPGFIAGNSLGVIYSEDNNQTILKFLLGIINSFTFEFLARQRLVSNHVPAGILRKIAVPQFAPNNKLTMLVEQQLTGKDVTSQIEVCVAKLYSISLDTLKKILSTYAISEEILKTIETAWELEKTE